MSRQRPLLPSEPPPEVVAYAAQRLREHGLDERHAPIFAFMVGCYARVLWRHELGLDT